jgi:undecaprenyl-diphosphatase
MCPLARLIEFQSDISISENIQYANCFLTGKIKNVSGNWRRAVRGGADYAILGKVGTTGRWVRVAGALCGLLAFGAMAYLFENGLAMAFDLPVRAAVHSWASAPLTAAMRLISVLGSEYFLVPLAVVLVWRWVRRGERSKAYVLVAAGLSAEAASQLLKLLFHRPRPELFFALTPPRTYSFPSGHSFVPVVYFGILVGLLGAGPWWRVGVAALAGLLGLSRVYLGYHYPSDVMAGWALAVVWLSVWGMIAARQARR